MSSLSYANPIQIPRRIAYGDMNPRHDGVDFYLIGMSKSCTGPTLEIIIYMRLMQSGIVLWTCL